MNFNRIGAIVLRQFFLMRGSLARVLPLFIWVGIDMVLWGFTTKYLNTFASPGFNFVPSLLGSVLLWDFLIRVMQGVTTTFFEDVWSRNFLNIFGTPIRIQEYLSGLVLASIATSAVGLLVMVVLATAIFSLSFLAYGLMLVPFLLVLFACGIALGVFGSAIVLRVGPSGEWFVWPVPAVLSPFVGVFYPLSTLPPWMRAISRALPPSYVFESVRAIAAGKHVSVAGPAWGACLAVLYIAIACRFFTGVYGHAMKTGLIARYSAETIG